MSESKENYETHTIKRPENCTCDGSRYCNICDGGLSFCVVCNGGEIELEEKTCAERQIENEKNRWIADILAAPHEWDRFYIFADWLDEQGLELEAEQWRYRGQYFGQWIEADIDSRDIIALRLSMSVHEKGFLFASTHIEDECWCKKKGLRYVPKWPVTLEDVRKGRDGQ